MDCSTAKGKDGSDREGWGAVVNSIFWKRLLNAQEGSRDLSILLLEGEKTCCDPDTQPQRMETLPVFPRVSRHTSTLASQPKKWFQPLLEARDQG